MKAINLDREYQEIMLKKDMDVDVKVEPISDVIKRSFKDCDYQHINDKGSVTLFERVFVSEEQVPQESKWTHYKIGNGIYKSYLTNDLDYWEEESKTFNTQEQEEYQLSLF